MSEYSGISSSTIPTTECAKGSIAMIQSQSMPSIMQIAVLCCNVAVQRSI